MSMSVRYKVSHLMAEPDKACLWLETELRETPSGYFDALIDVDFTNSLESVRAVFVEFAAECRKSIGLTAIYAETNGFEINPGLWFCSLFAYDTVPPRDVTGAVDMDWLAEFVGDIAIPMPEFTLTGMESIQQIYAQLENETEEVRYDADLQHGGELASLLIVCRFCRLIQEATIGLGLGVPVFATGHGFEMAMEVPCGISRGS